MNTGKNHLNKPFWTKTKSYYLCVGRIALIYNHRIVDTNLFYRKLASFIYLPTASHLWRKNGDLTYLLVSICTCLLNEKTKFSLLVGREIFQRIKSYSICRLLISIEIAVFLYSMRDTNWRIYFDIHVYSYYTFSTFS